MNCKEKHHGFVPWCGEVSDWFRSCSGMDSAIRETHPSHRVFSLRICFSVDLFHPVISRIRSPTRHCTILPRLLGLNRVDCIISSFGGRLDLSEDLAKRWGKMKVY